MPNWSGLFDGVHGQPHALLNEPGSSLRGIARLMAPQALRAYGRLGDMLTGSVLGSVINRVTTAADEAMLDNQFTPHFAPATYPPDLSGNGGGGKTYSL